MNAPPATVGDNAHAAQALAAIAAALPAEALTTDAAQLRLHAQDIFTDGPAPLALIRPRGTAQLQAALAAAAPFGLAIIPRGGGMSYTSGYVAPNPGALLVDLGGMDRILDINQQDMTVTVEAGCSWHQLYQALHPLGLRAPVWGTLSGLYASVGGGMSQNGLFWGAREGTIAASVIAARIVLADGRVLDTGLAGGNSFLRPFGPDLSGLFGGDAGALGIKAEITLPLRRDGSDFAYASFAFDTPDAYCTAMSAIAREGLASEAFGFDPFLQAQRMRRDSLAADAKSLLGTMKAQGGFWRGLREGAKIVAAGRSFLDDVAYSVHLICEGRSAAAVAADLTRVREIVAQAGGREVENTIPKVLRANPFPPPNSMLGPAGERWAPIHGVVRHSRALETINHITALFEGERTAMEELGVGCGYMFLLVGQTGFLVEPCFYWPDERWPVHEHFVEPQHLARLPSLPPNPQARALVEKLRSAIIDIFARMDAVHFQLGRAYPLRRRLDPVAWELLSAVKRTLDPDGRMNPGALGLD